MNSEIVREILDQHLIPKQNYIYGFADLRNIIDQQFGDFQYGISIGKRLDNRIVDKIKSGPTLEYYNHYRRTNEELTSLSASISKSFLQAGVQTKFIEPTVTTEMLDTVYSTDLTTSLSHKMVATRAGLGWIGKSDLFVSKAFGPRLRLVSLLTNIHIDSDYQPIEKSRCGTCAVCVQKCPAGAMNGKLWDISVHRDEFFDPFKCRQKCKEFGERYLKMDVRVCGICVSVCPIGS